MVSFFLFELQNISRLYGPGQINLTHNLAFVKPILNEMPYQFVGLCYVESYDV